MKQTTEQPTNPNLSGEEILMQTLIDSVTANGAAVREITEQMQKLPDTTEILREVGKRITGQEKRQEELVGSLAELRGGLGELRDALGKVEGTLQKTKEELSFPEAAFSELRGSLQKHREYFDKPRLKEVHYRHFLGRPLISLGVAFLIISLLIVLLVRAQGRIDQHVENDLKWRYLHVFADTANLDGLNQVSQRFKANPEQFKKDVDYEEDRQQQLFEQHQRAMRAQEEILKLEGKKR